MILETALADALYLNWAIPGPSLPPLPAALSYDTALDGQAGERACGFFSLVLFRQVGLHLKAASWLALSYPQANARLYVRDAAGTPSIFLTRQLAPAWVVPIARIAIRVCPKGYRPRIEERIVDNRAQLQPSTLAVADSVMYREALACAAEARG